MKILLSLAITLFISLVFTGCFGSMEEYKPMSQVKPDKKPIKVGE